MTLRRYVVGLFRPAVGALVWLSVVASYNVTAAQVGHEPSHSPYHDVRRGGVAVLAFGYLGGNRGSVGVGLSDGKTAGIRYEVPFGAVGASRGLAPYVGGGFGVAISGTSPRDSSGYRFGSKFTIAPNAGLRWYPARRLSVRGDFRLVLWKLNYPVSYKQPASDGSRVLPLTASFTDWTAHPWATIGVGWTF